MTKLILVDWSERYPNENALTIAIRQSTVCACGRRKKIGALKCELCAFDDKKQ